MKTVLDAYINATYGTVRWLLFVALSAFDPIIRVGSALFGTLFTLAFLGAAVMISPTSREALMMLGAAIVCWSISMAYFLLHQRVLWDLLDPEPNEGEGMGLFTRLGVWVFFAATFAACRGSPIVT